MIRALPLLLLLAACGSEAPAAEDQVVARVEVCTVTIQPDGTVICTCVPAPEAP